MGTKRICHSDPILLREQNRPREKVSSLRGLSFEALHCININHHGCLLLFVISYVSILTASGRNI